MNHQHSHFEQNDTNNTYSYIFSDGTGAPLQKPPRNGGGGRRVGLVIVAILLCVTFSFVAGMAGMLYADYLFPNASNNDGTTDTTRDPSELLHEDPDSILQKAESSKSIYGSAGEEAFAVSGVVRKVRDAVVVINAQMGYSSSGSTGSGVLISDTGYILTCNHVVEGAEKIQVTLYSGSDYDAALVGSDSASDLAVIKIEPRAEEPLTYVEQGCSGDLVVGESVVAIGNPLGIGITATTGVVSATERNIAMSDGSAMTLIQTDAAINSGNSGGGLFNLDGQLIGVVNAKYSASGVEGLAFAIPIDSAYPVEKQLIEYGYVKGVVDHGLSILEVTAENIYQAFRYYGIQSTGLYIFASEYSTEFKQLDRIVALGGESVDSYATFKRLINQYSVGDTVEIRVVRGTSEATVSLTLQEYVPDRLKNEAE